MRKQSIIILIVVALVALLVPAGPVAAVAEDNPSAIIPFEGYRVRDRQVRGPEQIVGCRILRASQEAWWTVTTDNDLVTGQWYNYDTKVNREVIQYLEEGVLVDCIPSDPPDPVPTGPGSLVLGVGVVHGPFMLTPDADVGGGVWDGEWKLVHRPDGSIHLTATAQGIGGDLEGLTLKVSYDGIPQPPQPFNGFIGYPPSADGG